MRTHTNSLLGLGADCRIPTTSGPVVGQKNCIAQPPGEVILTSESYLLFSLQSLALLVFLAVWHQFMC